MCLWQKNISKKFQYIYILALKINKDLHLLKKKSFFSPSYLLKLGILVIRNRILRW